MGGQAVLEKYPLYKMNELLYVCVYIPGGQKGGLGSVPL